MSSIVYSTGRLAASASAGDPGHPQDSHSPDGRPHPGHSAASPLKVRSHFLQNLILSSRDMMFVPQPSQA